ncbi:MAG TPA: hypothetical protein VEU47_05595 [Candidatus Cybelea sp.]|nr:hypothetical protein [Candidatus Cybelea sp.]
MLSILIWVVVTALFVVPFWRIFERAGLAGPIALIGIIPGIGPLVLMAVLAFSRWPNLESSGGTR